jgi:DNA-binding beta-propeller fold protein YncE
MKFQTLLLIAAAAIGLAADPKAVLQLVQTVDLPGIEGRFDHFAVDLKAERLYVAALGSDTLVAISFRGDDSGDKVFGKATGLEEPQGVLVVPGSGEVAVASGKDGKLRVFDGSFLKLRHDLDVGDDADNVRFDATAKRIYVGCEKALAVIDAIQWKKVSEIPLDAHAESFQLEKVGQRIFVNVPNAEQVAVIDRKKGTVIAKWKLEGASQNFPMALDEPRHRLLVGCRKPPRIIVLDTESGKQTASIDCSGDMDDLFVDAAGRRVYASCGEGFIDVFERNDEGRYTRLSKVATAPGARTSLLVPDLSRLFLAVPHRGTQKAEVRAYQIKD